MKDYDKRISLPIVAERVYSEACLALFIATLRENRRHVLTIRGSLGACVCSFIASQVAVSPDLC